MKINFVFFAEAAQITSDGRLNVLGAGFQKLQVSGQPPWVAMSLVTSVHLEREECGRLYHITAELISPSEDVLQPRLDQDFVTPAPQNVETVGVPVHGANSAGIADKPCLGQSV
jgi:uncharacterized protein DUF6941